MTILELIQRTTEFFQKKGVEEPRLQIELLLAHILGLKRMQLYLQFERELKESELLPLREMVRRRAEHEPLQYILGKTEFFGLEFNCDKRALIPRRETEHLIETALGLYPDKSAPLSCADLGTGTGILAITLAVHLAASRWTAADASAEALALAKANAAKHSSAERMEFLQSSWWSGFPAEARFDLIVSNPPYIKSDDIRHLAPELREHEPVPALDGGADGLEGYRAISAGARAHAREGARLCMEIGFDQATAVEDLLRGHGWNPEAPIKDLQGHDRVILASLA
jgi:release factor glutamine methyltransferase